MAGQQRKKKDPPAAAEVEVVEQTPNQRVAEQAQREAEGEATDVQAQQEFNEFIVQLATNAAQQEVAALDERVRDLERLVQVLIGQVGAQPDPSARPVRVLTPEEMPSHDVGTPDYDVPEYRPAHQGGDGTDWYRP